MLLLSPNIVFITLVFVLLFTIPGALVLLVCYVRKVEKLMGRDEGGAGGAAAPEGAARVRALPLWRPARPRPELRLEHVCDSTPLRAMRRGAARLWAHARRARYSTAAVYTLVALAHLATLWLVLSWVSRLPPDSSVRLVAGVVLLWPAGQAFFSHAGGGLGVKASAAALYLLAVWAVARGERQDAPGDLPERFALIVFAVILVPMAVRALVMNERLKAAGLTVLVLLTGVAVGIVLTAELGRRTGIGVPLMLLAGILVVPATTAVACLSIWWMVRRHVRRKASDRMAVSAVYWLMLSEWFTYVMASVYGPWALFALGSFASLVVAHWAGFKALGLFMRGAPGDVRLLLLRTFTKRGRVESLLDGPGRGAGAWARRNLLRLWRVLRRDTLIHRLEMRWRFVGSIQLIAGPDLATAYVDVDELVDWATGRLGRRFISTDEDLAARTAIDPRPDPDGRYRVNEFFCGGEMWGRVLVELLGRDATHVVLMDLRGFTAANAGVVHELGQLVQHVTLRRVVLAVDHRTDFPLLERKLREFWRGVCECSPNYREPDPTLRLLHVGRGGRGAQRLLALLLRAAEEGAAAPAEKTERPALAV
ncbi:MAG TPA: hypothetical protein VF621_17195 [Pyrinomonadaceae bacterium]